MTTALTAVHFDSAVFGLIDWDHFVSDARSSLLYEITCTTNPLSVEKDLLMNEQVDAVSPLAFEFARFPTLKPCRVTWEHNIFREVRIRRIGAMPGERRLHCSETACHWWLSGYC